MNFAGGHFAGRLQQPDYGVADGGFAGAGFANNAENFARLDIDGQALDGHDVSPPARELDPHFLYF